MPSRWGFWLATLATHTWHCPGAKCINYIWKVICYNTTFAILICLCIYLFVLLCLSFFAQFLYSFCVDLYPKFWFWIIVVYTTTVETHWGVIQKIDFQHPLTCFDPRDPGKPHLPCNDPCPCATPSDGNPLANSIYPRTAQKSKKFAKKIKFLSVFGLKVTLIVFNQISNQFYRFPHSIFYRNDIYLEINHTPSTNGQIRN